MIAADFTITRSTPMQTKIGSLQRWCVMARMFQMMLWFCGALFVMQAKGDRFWTRAFPAPVLPEPGKRYDASFRFTLDVVRENLIADGSYYNYSVKNQTPRTVIIDGTKTPDGTFWPTVKCLVANDVNGEWIAIKDAPRNGKASTLKVKVEAIKNNLSINLKNFESSISTFKFGKVVLTTGDSTVFSLSDLLPPSY